MSENIGNKFDDFIILKILKKSKVQILDEEYLYGYVAKVKSKLDGKIYAMKRIDKSKLSDQTKIKYDNEYKMAKYFIENNNLKHKNLYNPMKVFKDKNIIYIISEYIDGNNIYDLYNEVDIKVSEKRLVKIFDQCLQGLIFIHKNGIIHRCIDFNNIMIDSEDRVKIINFSYAIKKEKDKEITDKTKNKYKIFNAPEIDNGKYNELIDVYALGMVFNYFKSRDEKVKKKEKDQKDQKDQKDKNDQKEQKKENFFDNFYLNIINKMKEKDSNKRPSAEKIHYTFKNKYNNIIKAFLQSFLFCLKGEILKKDVKNDNAQIDLKESKIEELKKKIIKLAHETNININLISEVAFLLEEEFYRNSFEINDLTIKNIANFIMCFFHDNKILNDFDSNIYLKLKKTSKCTNCKKSNEEIISIDKIPNIILNANDIKGKKEEKKEEKNIIKNFLMNFNNKKPTQITEYCEKCDKTCSKDIFSKYINFPKFIVILIENDIDISQIKEDNLNKFEFQDVENKKNYELISMILENKESYDYYNREKEENKFTKNEHEKKEDGEDVYNFSDMKGNIICLIYRVEKNENNNNGNESQSSTKAESINNEGNEKQREDNQNNNNNNNSQQNSNNNNEVKMNNFL